MCSTSVKTSVSGARFGSLVFKTYGDKKIDLLRPVFLSIFFGTLTKFYLVVLSCEHNFYHAHMEQEKKESGIVIYRAKDGKVQLKVALENETIWLSQKQMADLFSKDVNTVGEHIQHVFKDEELAENRVTRKFRVTAADGKVYETNYYNLDVIISVGYRVKSIQGTQFRIWATQVLRDHILQGFTINQKRLLEQTGAFTKLQETITFIKNKSAAPELQSQAQELLTILADYATSFTWLHQYDEDTLQVRKQTKAWSTLSYTEAQSVILEAATFLRKKKESGELFGREYTGKLVSIIGSLNQTFDGKDVYATIEEKAAHLLYFTIKDHPFTDGNKRLAALLFIFFLQKNKYLYKATGERKITDTTLVSLALLVAMSQPREKDVMVRLITNLLG